MGPFAVQLNMVVASYFLVFVRIISVFISMPVIGTKLVPLRIRVILGILIAAVVIPMLGPLPHIDPFSINGIVLTIYQVLIGIIIGLVVQVMFQVVILGGQVLAMQSGLGFATMNDPQQRQNIPMVSQFYLMSVTLLFLSFNGHLLAIKLLVDSFHTLPIAQDFFSRHDLMLLIKFTSVLFSGAVSIALPAIVSLLIVNFTFGIMTKAAPQLNIFAIGFPITLLFGLAIMGISFPVMMSNVKDIMGNSFELVRHVLRIP